MSRLPVCSGQDAIRAFQKLGYQVDHQTGSHIILRTHKCAVSRCPTTGNWPREHCGH
jgi:predicted RNA binding protein YcfA (HicA-like mRNA interferase family)